MVNDKYRDIFNQWRKLKNPVSTLEFVDSTCLPKYLPIENVIAGDIKYYKKIGLDGCTFFASPPDGVFGQYSKESNSWLTLWQMYYIAAKLLWDVDGNFNEIYEDMGSQYYGKTWPVMREYRALLVKSLTEHSSYPSSVLSPFLVAGKCLEKPGLETKLLQLLDDAEKSASGDEIVLKKIKHEREYFQAYWQSLYKEFLSKR
jgi:hypothetical protein